MVKLNLTLDDEKLSFSVPQNWGEVTVQQYADLHKISSGLTYYENMVERINIVSHIDKESAWLLEQDDLNKLSEILKFISTAVEDKHVESINVGDDTYYLKHDFNKLNVGEIASLNMLAEGAETDSALLARFPELLCIFLRKKKDNGNLEAFRLSHMNRADSFKDIPIQDVHKLFLFFSNGNKKSKPITKPSLGKKKTKQNKGDSKA